MRVLLIQPGKREKFAAPFGYVEPLGLESVAGAITDICDLDFIDLRFSTLEDLKRIVESERVDACGITSSFTMDYNQAIKAAEIVKQVDSRVFVFVGGHHPSLMPDDFNLPSIDAIVMGEGEATTRELIEVVNSGSDLAKVTGLAFRRHGKQLLTPPRALIHDLDSLPYHDSSIVEDFRRRYRLFVEKSVTSLETIRGCQFQCNFCSVWKFYRGKVRMKSPERVINEIKSVKSDNVFFVDDNFFASPRRADRIADAIKREGIMKRYLIQARSDAIALHPGLIDKWAGIGLRSAFLGFEKVSQCGLDAVEKHNSVQSNEKALEILRDHGIEPVVSFIADPEFQGDEFLLLRNYVKKLSLKLPFFTMLTPLPGTELFDSVREDLMRSDYDFFDLMHPVLPTRLPTKEFIRQFCMLYKTGYPTPIAFAGSILLLFDVMRGRLSFSDWREIVRDWRIVTTPEKYLAGLSTSAQGSKWKGQEIVA
ncbi:MAG TPA: cobalamin-dependent protein [Candidatus Acidoferrales bacterium]|nr:cobalamin-dependent protein [Candidatus Acidoferrales bacterium]